MDEPLRNNPISALAIRLLVAKGHVTQEIADWAFHLACSATQDEARKMGVDLPWVVANPRPEGGPLTEDERRELLDWVSACQSSYHIDSTPGHRFAFAGSNLDENRESLVDYVNDLLAARVAKPA